MLRKEIKVKSNLSYYAVDYHLRGNNVVDRYDRILDCFVISFLAKTKGENLILKKLRKERP